MTGILLAALVIGLPAMAFTLWPVFRRGPHGVLLPLPPDARAELTEQKRAVLRALRELEFEHGAGHVSDDDYADLRARFEEDAARILAELDQLGPVERTDAAAARDPRPAAARRASAWQHPAALATAAVILVAFGVALGAGIVRHSAPEPPAETAMPGGRAPAAVPVTPGVAGPDGTPPAANSGTALAPGMLQGMLAAARESLFAGRYSDAIAAYQAILKRDAKNVDAMTHLGLIVAIGGHVDSALETFDRALAIDPDYAPALLYRGQVLYDSKQDVEGALRTWEKFVAVAPAGEDRDRVAKILAENRNRPGRSAADRSTTTRPER